MAEVIILKMLLMQPLNIFGLVEKQLELLKLVHQLPLPVLLRLILQLQLLLLVPLVMVVMVHTLQLILLLQLNYLKMTL